MNRHWIEYHDRWQDSPLSFWVHTGQDSTAASEGPISAPPKPGPVPGKGYATLHVECDGFVFQFSSLAEVDHCIDVISQRNLPSTIRLTKAGPGGKGPNGHWLSRLPANVKPWSYRERAIRRISAARELLDTEFQRSAV